MLGVVELFVRQLALEFVGLYFRKPRRALMCMIETVQVTSVESTSDPKTLLDELVQSLAQTGQVFTGLSTCNDYDGGYFVTLQLVPHAFTNNAIGKRLKETLKQYLRAYVRERGWTIRKTVLERTYVGFDIAPSRALSKAAKNP